MMCHWQLVETLSLSGRVCLPLTPSGGGGTVATKGNGTFALDVWMNTRPWFVSECYVEIVIFGVSC